MRRVRWPVGMLAVLLVAAGCGGTSTHTVTQKVPVPVAHGAGVSYPTPYGPSAHSPTFGLPPKGVRLPRPLPASTPTLTMLDSVSSISIFSGLNPLAVAGYTSGSWPTYFNYAGHFKYVVAVMVNSSHYGIPAAARSCLDVEPGDAAPSAAGPWDKIELAHGFVPCDYGSLSEMPAIKSSIASSGISLSRVYLWDANWTFSPHLDAGYQATQWTDHYDGRNIDGSTVSLAFVSNATKPAAVICWGKGATPKSSACLKIEAESKKLWVAYLAFHRAIPAHEKALSRVAPYPGYYEQVKKSISVPAYKGVSIGYSKGRIATEQKWQTIKLAAHKKLDAAHTRH